MIARSIPPAIIGEILRDWPLFLAVVIAVIAASSTLGWLLTRWRVLPGTTAVWGSSPGAASAMMLMAAAYGADIRLVAFMQYLRVLFVALVATIVARVWTAGAGPAGRRTLVPADRVGAVRRDLGADRLRHAGRHGCAASRPRHCCCRSASASRLQDAGVLTIELPPWLLAASYTARRLEHRPRASTDRSWLTPPGRCRASCMSILVLIAVCGGLAALLVVLAGIDPLTAYLATSPGGANSAAIIAVASNVDVAFVMAMQTTRLVLVLLIGPSLAEFIARLTGGKQRRL